MDIDLPAILLWVVLVLGVIWLIDKLVFEKSRLAQNADAEDPKLVEYSKAFFSGFISGFDHQEFYWRALPNPI